MSERYTKRQHAVGGSTWHFEWCTKYRYKVFNKVPLKNICFIALSEAAKRYGVKIEVMDVEPNHVHMVVHIPLTMSPTKAVGLLKGFSAKIIFALKPKLRYLYPKGSLWSPGKFVGSVGDVDIKYVVEYVKNQKTHHAKACSLSRESSPRSEAEGSPEGRGFSPRRRSILNDYLTKKRGVKHGKRFQSDAVCHYNYSGVNSSNSSVTFKCTAFVRRSGGGGGIYFSVAKAG
jgi:putative transposase